MEIKFWGVRGSIACPGPDTVHFGGNTACVEICFKEIDRVIIIDAGSGIRVLGHDLKKRKALDKPLMVDIFLSHTHWDHIMGFPFFDPIYLSDTKLNIYGPVTYEEDPLDKIIGDQLSYRYFPVRHSELASKLTYHQIGETELDLGDGIHLKTKFLNHTLQCLGYRFEYQGKSICTAYDTEPYRNLFAMPPDSPAYDPVTEAEGERASKEENDRLVDFYRNADALIHDAQYTSDEYEQLRLGWGHSPYDYAVEAAVKAKVKTLFFFHHDPLRTDEHLSSLEKRFQEETAKNSPLKIFAAREGTTFEL